MHGKTVSSMEQPNDWKIEFARYLEVMRKTIPASVTHSFEILRLIRETLMPWMTEGCSTETTAKGVVCIFTFADGHSYKITVEVLRE